MTIRARKTAKNLALKVAIVARGKTQREIARRTGIPEVRLSMFVRGVAQPSGDEKKALAKCLRRAAGDIFPSSVDDPALDQAAS